MKWPTFERTRNITRKFCNSSFALFENISFEEGKRCDANFSLQPFFNHSLDILVYKHIYFIKSKFLYMTLHYFLLECRTFFRDNFFPINYLIFLQFLGIFKKNFFFIRIKKFSFFSIEKNCSIRFFVLFCRHQ